jgi:hypothetical protein
MRTGESTRAKEKIKMMKKAQIYAGCSIFFSRVLSAPLLITTEKKGTKKEREIQSIQRRKKSGMSPAESGHREVDEERSDWTQHIRTSCSLYL